MCYFVFVGVPSQSAITVEGLERTDLLLRPVSSPSVCTVFPKHHTVFEVTDGACSCRLYPTEWEKHAEAMKRAKYERKGWSKRKIERALNDKRQHDLRKPNPGRSFIRLLNELVVTTGEVSLFAHWFEGSIDDEPLNSHSNIKRYKKDGWDFPLDTLVVVQVSKPI